MKHIFVFFLFISLGYPSISQHVLIGPKAGIQATRAFFDDEEYYNEYRSLPALNYHAGVVGNIKVTDLFSLHTELLLNQTGKKLKGKDDYSLARERYRNLTAPVLLRASFPIGYNQVYINAGPNLSYWLGGRGSIRIPELLEGDIEELDYSIRFGDRIDVAGAFYVSDPNRLQLGIDIGAGALLPMGRDFLMVDLRYTWGHTNMAKTESSYMNFLFFNDDLAYANHGLSLSVAYLFEFDFFTMMTKGKSKSKK